MIFFFLYDVKLMFLSIIYVRRKRATNRDLSFCRYIIFVIFIKRQFISTVYLNSFFAFQSSLRLIYVGQAKKNFFLFFL